MGTNFLIPSKAKKAREEKGLVTYQSESEREREGENCCMYSILDGVEKMGFRGSCM